MMAFAAWFSRVQLAAKANSVLTSSVAAGFVGCSVLAGAVAASDSVMHAPSYDWSHNGWWKALDSASVRRGYEVYRQVCSTCHSMELLRFRHLVGTSHTEDQAKALAASYVVVDGPNDEGEMFERPGRLLDVLPKPYANESLARYVNGGAIPPDLSLIVKARHGHEDYIFALLTGYRPLPHGLELRDGLYYNPYFEGSAISMPPPLSEGQMDNEDGTPASVPQMAKDVSTFLLWAGEPETDERKKVGLKLVALTMVGIGFAGFYKRFKFAHLKTRKIRFLY